MGLLDQQNLLCPKIHLPASLHALADTQTIKKTQKMLVTEETGYAAYGNSVQSSQFFYKSKNSSKISFKKIQEEWEGKEAFHWGGNVNDQMLGSQLHLSHVVYFKKQLNFTALNIQQQYASRKNFKNSHIK